MPKKSTKTSDTPARQKPLHISPEQLSLYAHAFHNSAKTLASAFHATPTPFPNIEVSPVVLMYRHSVELQLKAIVLGSGGNFLPEKPDVISVHQSHAVNWLAQFIRQIITALQWQHAFTCDGIQSLADFKAAIDQINLVDPGTYIYLPEAKDSVPGSGKLTFSEFTRRMDALLEFLSHTADALAAEWDLRSAGGSIERTIH